ESQALAALPGTARRDAFLALWTHKEAAVKGLGIGFGAHLWRIEVYFDPGRGLRLAAGGGDQYRSPKWAHFLVDSVPGSVAPVAGAHPIRCLTLHNWCHTGAD